MICSICVYWGAGRRTFISTYLHMRSPLILRLTWTDSPGRTIRCCLCYIVLLLSQGETQFFRLAGLCIVHCMLPVPFLFACTVIELPILSAWLHNYRSQWSDFKLWKYDWRLTMTSALYRSSRRDDRPNHRLPKTLLGTWVPRVHRRTLHRLIFDNLLLWAQVHFLPSYPITCSYWQHWSGTAKRACYGISRYAAWLEVSVSASPLGLALLSSQRQWETIR